MQLIAMVEQQKKRREEKTKARQRMNEESLR